jgi:hypothetical protein
MDVTYKVLGSFALCCVLGIVVKCATRKGAQCYVRTQRKPYETLCVRCTRHMYTVFT